MQAAAARVAQFVYFPTDDGGGDLKWILHLVALFVTSTALFYGFECAPNGILYDEHSPALQRYGWTVVLSAAIVLATRALHLTSRRLLAHDVDVVRRREHRFVSCRAVLVDAIAAISTIQFYSMIVDGRAGFWLRIVSGWTTVCCSALAAHWTVVSFMMRFMYEQLASDVRK
jgi:hypothetical protein